MPVHHTRMGSAMIDWRAHWEYISYLARHKLYVYREGRSLGLGRWQLLIHDWSKLLPSEWFGYVEWKRSQTLLEAGGTVQNNRGFGMPWFLHTHKRMHHHPQYWLYMDDRTGVVEPLEIPDRYRREMLADWRAAQMVRFGNRDVRPFYESNRDKYLMHPTTRAWLEEHLED